LNKLIIYHRHNHHTQATIDPRYPDAAHDPIASPESPFLGPFVMYGPLSAIAIPPGNVVGTYSISAVGLTSVPIAGVFAAPSVTAIGVDVQGSIHASGTLKIDGAATVNSINFTGNILNTYSTPIPATGGFLQLTINDYPRYIRLLNF